MHPPLWRLRTDPVGIVLATTKQSLPMLVPMIDHAARSVHDMHSAHVIWYFLAAQSGFRLKRSWPSSLLQRCNRYFHFRVPAANGRSSGRPDEEWTAVWWLLERRWNSHVFRWNESGVIETVEIPEGASLKAPSP